MEIKKVLFDILQILIFVLLFNWMAFALKRAIISVKISHDASEKVSSIKISNIVVFPLDIVIQRARVCGAM